MIYTPYKSSPLPPASSVLAISPDSLYKVLIQCFLPTASTVPRHGPQAFPWLPSSSSPWLSKWMLEGHLIFRRPNKETEREFSLLQALRSSRCSGLAVEERAWFVVRLVPPPQVHNSNSVYPPGPSLSSFGGCPFFHGILRLNSNELFNELRQPDLTFINWATEG